MAATESKYKVGDWVRVIDNGGAPYEFTVGEVCRVTDINGGLLWVGQRAMFPHRFEPWRPRVGELVRVNYSDQWAGIAIVCKVDCVYAYATMETGEKAGTRGGFRFKEIEPAAAKLTIQAGKFYKTRDGRKVGPMQTWPNNEGGVHLDRLCEVIGSGRYWMLDGRDGTSNGNDLIAEWPATPTTTNVAATVDAQAEEYGPVVAATTKPKFNIGDRVYAEWMDTKGNGTVVKYEKRRPDDTMTHAVRFDSGPTFWVRDSTIRAMNPTPSIVCLIENGQPLPASRPYVHATTESAATEAKRMAGIHKGQEFGVFALTGETEKVAKAYAHEWQRLAANDDFEGAASALASQTGIILYDARRAAKHWKLRA